MASFMPAFLAFLVFVSLSALLEGVSVVRDDVDYCCGWKWLGYMSAWHTYCRTRLDPRLIADFDFYDSEVKQSYDSEVKQSPDYRKFDNKKPVYEAAEYY